MPMAYWKQRLFLRRHTLRAPPLRANQPPPLRSRLPTPFLPCHCASLPAIRHSAPLHLAHTRCPSPIAHESSRTIVRNNLRPMLPAWQSSMLRPLVSCLPRSELLRGPILAEKFGLSEDGLGGLLLLVWGIAVLA